MDDIQGYTPYKDLIDSFWSNGPTKRLNAEVMLDTSETPNNVSRKRGFKDNVTNNTVIGVRTYRDQTFIIHGTDFGSQIKVITPNSIRIYKMFSPSLMMNLTYVYNNITILSDHELIIGFFYVNLKTQIVSMYGIVDDTFLKIRGRYRSLSSCSDGADGWVTSDHLPGERNITVTSYWKVAPEHCFDCESQKSLEGVPRDEIYSDRCKEEKFTARSFQFRMRGREQLVASGKPMGLSTQRDGLLGNLIDTPSGRMSDCSIAISKYRIIFSTATLEPTALGATGLQVSESCPHTVLKNLGDILQYKEATKKLYDDYLETRTNDDSYDNEMLVEQSLAIVENILPFLTTIDVSGDTNDAFEQLFTDMIWWAPILFAIDPPTDPDRNLYFVASYKTSAEVADLFTKAVEGISFDESKIVGDNRYIIKRSDRSKGDLVKNSGNNLTTFQMHGGGTCFASKIITSLPKDKVDSIVEVEHRDNGTLLWGYKYSTTADHFYADLSLFFVPKGTKRANLIQVLPLPDKAQPIDGTAKCVTRVGNTWKIHDFFFNGTEIDWVTSEVPIDEQMRVVADSGVGGWHSNISEIIVNGQDSLIIPFNDGYKENRETMSDGDLNDKDFYPPAFIGNQIQPVSVDRPDLSEGSGNADLLNGLG